MSDGGAQLAEGHEVGESAQGADDYLGLGLKLGGLLLEGRAAEEDDGLGRDRRRLREALGLAAYLDGELLGRRRDDGEGLSRALALEDGDELEGGREVGEGLAGARLRFDDGVAPREDGRYSLGLNGSGGAEAEGGEGLREGLGEAEEGEGFHRLMIARAAPPSQGPSVTRASLHDKNRLYSIGHQVHQPG